MAIKVSSFGGKPRKRKSSNIKGVKVSGTVKKVRRKTEAEKQQEQFLKDKRKREQQKKDFPTDTAATANVKSTQANIANILKAAQEQKLVELLYKDSNNKRARRVVEPYSFKYGDKGLKLMAYCRLRKDIRSFYLRRISYTAILAETYIPQYDVTIEKDFKALAHKIK